MVSVSTRLPTKALCLATLAAVVLGATPGRAAVDSRQVLLKAMSERFTPVIENGIHETCPSDGNSWHDGAVDRTRLKGAFHEDSVAFCDSYLTARQRLNSEALSPWNAYEFYAYRPDYGADNRYVRLLVGPFLGRRECDAHRIEVIKSMIDVTLCKPVALD
jgi:hypothetical protein